MRDRSPRKGHLHTIHGHPRPFKQNVEQGEVGGAAARADWWAPPSRAHAPRAPRPSPRGQRLSPGLSHPPHSSYACVGN
ncbi:hypothetical protein JYU34_007278 [Plutella xylostella]|uniref:Uncharacterized protein n=1 Tax=Plutella xylostella TaxID=51655 RepID=A0ABQ7QQ21_PLUXY|nr:hypothetical protein JYU34_007278 [Plutella xylostella]